VYDLILSDETSARLVSLFLKKIIDAVQVRQGLTKADIRFVSSGRHENEGIFESIEKLLEDLSPARVLVVTEFIYSGRSIQKLTDILELLNLKFDVAVFLASENGIEYVKKSFAEWIPETKIYLGGLSSNTPSLYGRSDLAGVFKSKDSLFPKRKISEHITQKHREELQGTINQAREDIELLAQRTLKRLNF
jgi:hypothetical protein